MSKVKETVVIPNLLPYNPRNQLLMAGANEGTKINLHHLIQEEPGTILVIPESLHKQYSKVIQGWKNNRESFRYSPGLSSHYKLISKKVLEMERKEYETQD